ncbi:MAG: 1,4-alpha-glucan branching protein GlgB, partial [Chloroflexota bacterium]|nr:1,4-alpha-glucan branching protein GlgB [Chloroflexota bacterium]
MDEVVAPDIPDLAERLAALLDGTLGDPHAFLGLHPVTAPGGGSALRARAFAPEAERVTLIEEGGGVRLPLARVGDSGLFAATLPGRGAAFPYRLELGRGAQIWERDDPYRFPPTLGEQDLHFVGEGTHHRLYEALGAHPRVVDGVAGVGFAVWAPAARGVSLIGDFNGWDRRAHPLRALGRSGVWELFVPGLGSGTLYKYAVRGADGVEREKADPLAFASELRPRTVSIVADLDRYAWGDGGWLAARREWDPYSGPMSIYEVHLGSWRRHADGSWLTYGELADALIPYLQGHGFTHIELLPVAEHPYDGSWGYQVTGFFAPTSRFGTPADFQAFVDRFHRAGLGVIVDWVPAHFAIDEHGLARFDGTYLYEPEDPRRRVQPDWGTFAFDYGRVEVRNFLLANALFWLDKYHIDGLRADAVSSMLYLDYSRGPGEWTPNRHGGREHLEAVDFLKAANELVYAKRAGVITVAEESTTWPGVSHPTYAGGLGFGFKWNMGWMHDTLEYFRKDPLYRRHHQGLLTFAMVYAYSENYVLALSHDEVVHGKGSLLHKMPGDEWQQFANLRLLFAWQHAMPGKKLIFMGDEFGQRGEWNHDRSVEWAALDYPPHAQARALVAALNRLHRTEPALHARDHEPAGFAWLNADDAAHSVLAFVRRVGTDGDNIVCVFNCTPVPRPDYRIPAPAAGRYRLALNTDAREWGGSGAGGPDVVEAEAREHKG